MRRRTERGQVLPLTVLLIVVLILFVGLALDAGFAYVTKASLSKAVDSAALMGMRNLAQGEPEAAQIARDAFQANYGTPGRDAAAPTVEIEFSTDPIDNHRTIRVHASVAINTFFVRVLPPWRQLTVGSTAEAVRSPLIMTLVLDRSRSLHHLEGNRGCLDLPPAVDNFIRLFDDTADQVGLVTFASDARLDVPVGHNFKTPISNAVPRDCNTDYRGFTFSDGGLRLAGQQNQSVVATEPNTVKVIVFFTDGKANTFQDNFTCPPESRLNLSGGDWPNVRGIVIDPDTGNNRCTFIGVPACCPGLTAFTSIDGTTQVPTPDAIRQEGVLRALATASGLRDEGNAIFTIGLGNGVDHGFLRQVANDPSSPMFTPTQPAGQFLFAADPEDLNSVFQSIAAQIVLRLTR